MLVRLNYKSRDINPASIARSLAEKWGLPYADPIRKKEARPFRTGEIPKFHLFDRESSLWHVHSHERSTAARLIDDHQYNIEQIIRTNKEPFRIREIVNLGDSWVGVGSPINVGYEAIPVYVHQNNQTRLVFAYRSKSQESWRRFAGYSVAHGIFWKGNPTNDHSEEHLQNFHFEIQRIIDEVYARTPIIHTLKGGTTKLEQLGVNAVAKTDDQQKIAQALIIRTEEAIQASMREGARQLTFEKDGDGISHLVSFWWSGDPKEGAYGHHLNLVVSNARDYMCIGVTDDGIFLKYLQPKNPDQINPVGAPTKTVTLSSEYSWLLTPLLEYSEYAVSAVEKRRIQGAREVRANATVMLDLSGGSRRQRILGLHDDTTSPLFELNAGLYPVYRLMRWERYDSVNSFLHGICSNGHELPLADNLPLRVVAVDFRLFDQRFTELKTALDIAIDLMLELPNGQRDLPQKNLLRLRSEYNLTTRELNAILRYGKFLINNMSKSKYGSDEYEADPTLQQIYVEATNKVERRITEMADRWAKDSQEIADFGVG